MLTISVRQIQLASFTLAVNNVASKYELKISVISKSLRLSELDDTLHQYLATLNSRL